MANPMIIEITNPDNTEVLYQQISNLLCSLDIGEISAIRVTLDSIDNENTDGVI